MFSQDYLSLRLVHLKPAEMWAIEGEGLFFILVKEGVGEFAEGAITYRVGSGDVLVWNGVGGGKICAAEDEELVFWSFSLTFEHLFPLFASQEICLLENVVDSLKAMKLHRSGTPLAAECHRLVAEVSPQNNLDHRTQLLRIVGAILTEEFGVAHPQRVGFIPVEEHMRQVFQQLSSDELLTLSVGELAMRFSCSRRHLNRLFLQHFGMSVAALRMEMRLLKAVSLLRNPNIKIINVAEQCGFNHLGLFNTCFKRRFANSPGQWRKTRARIEATPAWAGNSPANDILMKKGYGFLGKLDKSGAGNREASNGNDVSNGKAHAHEDQQRNFPPHSPRRESDARDQGT